MNLRSLNDIPVFPNVRLLLKKNICNFLMSGDEEIINSQITHYSEANADIDVYYRLMYPQYKKVHLIKFIPTIEQVKDISVEQFVFPFSYNKQ